MQTEFPEAALHVPTVLLPREDVPLTSWAVIACDQYTSEPELGGGGKAHRSGAVYAAAYLSRGIPETADRGAVVDAINACMDEYAGGGVLRELPPGFVSVERTMKRGVVRRGLMVALDLEHYDYRDGAQELIPDYGGHGAGPSSTAHRSAPARAHRSAAYHGADRRSSAHGYRAPFCRGTAARLRG